MSKRKIIALGTVACLVTGLAILFLASRTIDTSEPHLGGALNDQISYINTARGLADRHELHTYIVLPATLWRTGVSDVLYLPGHAATMAVAYKLFGFGAFQSILPSLIAYLISILAIYFIGVRLYGPPAGMVGAFLFAALPVAIFFSFTAMSELTVVAAFTAAVAGFLYLPPRLRPWLGPLFLLVSFLFRETAAFAVVPLGLFWWLDRREQRWRALLFVALSIFLMGVVYRTNFAARRPSMIKAHIFGNAHAMYDDAVAQRDASQPTLQDWTRVLPARTWRNIKGLFSNPEYVPGAAVTTYAMMLAMLLVLVVAITRRDSFAISVTLLNACLLAATLIFVSVNGYRGVRFFLFAYALDVVVVASWLVGLVKDLSLPINKRRMVTALAGVAAIVVLTLSLFVVRVMYVFFANQDALDRRAAAFVETLNVDRSRMLVTPFVCTRYRYDHFPTPWSMLPYNEETLDLLAKRYNIGMMLVPFGHPLIDHPAKIESLGFYQEKTLRFETDVYVVYRRAKG